MGVALAAVGSVADRAAELIAWLAGGYALVMTGVAVSAGIQWYQESRRRPDPRPDPMVATGRHDAAGGRR